MYRATSPIFDVPEFPTLRRVKPLPKRRRTLVPQTTMPDPDQVATANPSFLASALDGLQLPGPNATAEELLAHAETLSARMALQSYYMGGGVPDFFTRPSGNNNSGKGAGNANDFRSSVNSGAGYGGGREEEDEHEDGDYIDHLQQPGNTKKRKVPANASNSFRGLHDPGSTDGQEEPSDRGIPTGRSDYEVAETCTPLSTFSMLSQKKNKLTAATLAGLQHKEMLKTRKRQLAAVLGALSHGDTLALDQALSANYPFAGSGFQDLKNGQQLSRVRLSRRRVVRMARGARRHPRHPDQVPFPVCSFSFLCPSATADRLISTKEEVIMLRNRFEAELARQATKAAKIAAASRLMASLPAKGSRSKRADRVQQKARAITNGKGEEPVAESADQMLTGIKTRGGKKKKRSALANASNPHHLRNYVPSRLPSSTQTVAPNQPNVNAQNYLGPIPLRFLTAEIPPRRKKTPAVQPVSQLTNPAEEWICAFCEYSLFYGDDQGYRKAIRNRKKILRRRRRARERAAAAASGHSTVKAAEKNESANDDYDALFEPEEILPGVPKQSKWKGDHHKDRDQSSYG